MITGYYISVEVDEEGEKLFEVGNFECPDKDFLRTAQGLVGGPIEAIPTADSITIFVNEDGKNVNLPRNEMADVFWQSFDKYGCLANGDYLVGTVLIMGPSSRAGRTTSAPPNTVDLIQALCQP